MNKFIFLAAIMLCGIAHARAELILTEKLDQQVQHYVQQEQFQGVVLVAEKGNILLKKAYGYADIESNLPNTVSKKFLIGSLTKSFTAVAILRLVDKGKLDLHEPLGTYIPDFKKTLSEKLTLHLLLKHQSGLVPHLEGLTQFEEKDITSADMLDIINTSKLSFVPGSAYQYSNLNHHLAAMVIENITEKSYAKAMQELVFTPLGMKNSGVERLGHIPSNRAKGYRKEAFGVKHDENIVSYALGSGDIYSTVDDLFRWEQALYGNNFLSQEMIEFAFSGESEAFGNYGYGFRVREYQRAAQIQTVGTLTRHGGSMDGFYSNLHRYIDDRLTVIVLANIRAFPIRKMTFELKEIAVGAEGLNRNRKRLE
ncbi:serine hydrolase domain-containing protein [Alteromonas sp. ASW11-130]|uniref:serine hydrolase domain-containing protein n=1 Tax=Alteromonas sp. ASW11-130 TaxID=3015775 RepID=UPI0022421DC7|nr:serine hydrolase domain-containing protein [Alteromonas sp. ASW11-130]MCW8091422.1 beta-lactamase family protein [Alteromonas sp. ASW11-130]